MAELVYNYLTDYVDHGTAVLLRPGGEIVERSCRVALGGGYEAKGARIRRPYICPAMTDDLWNTYQRLTPWCELVLVPMLLHDGEEIGGCFDGTNRIIVSASGRQHGVLFHECWHAIESRLNEDIIYSINTELCASICDLDPYFSQPHERRAETFSVWCLRFAHGLPSFMTNSEIDMVFNSAWTGRLGRELA